MLVRPDALQRLTRGALIGRVGVSVDEEHAYGLGAPLEQRSCGLSHLVRIDRRQQRAVREHTLVYFQAHVARYDGREGRVQSPGARAIAAPHLQNVLEALRVDDANPRAAPLQQRIRAHGRAVHYRSRPRRRAQAHLYTAANPLALVRARRRHLGHVASSAVDIEEQQIGKRSADVDADERSPARCHYDGAVP